MCKYKAAVVSYFRNLNREHIWLDVVLLRFSFWFPVVLFIMLQKATLTFESELNLQGETPPNKSTWNEHVETVKYYISHALIVNLV